MCGIAGHISPRPVSEGTLAAMLAEMRHRGPDSTTQYADGPFQAGMCRLAINGLASGGQPLFSEDGQVALLYNGEIYNSPALRARLKAQGVRLRTESDGEVIPHLYARHGVEAFSMLDGMFACALWDRRRQRLVLARDIPGEKPLYYTLLPGGGLAFASEVKALRLLPGLRTSLDYRAIWDYPTFLWIPEPDTTYKEIKALEKGHVLVLEGGRVSQIPIENRFAPAKYPRSHKDRVALVRQVVTEATHSRLLSEVPVGSFLSGGLDSSIIAALAVRRLPSLTTLTVAFEDVADPYHGTADESPFARLMAERLGTRHVELRVDEASFRSSLDEFVRHADQPFAVSSGLGILAVARKAREIGIKVLLSGDCADECFGGYSWYRFLHLKGRPPYTQASGGLCMQNVGHPLRAVLADLRARPAAHRAWAWHYYASEEEKRRLFHPDVAATAVSSLRHFEAHNPAPEWAPEEFLRQDRNFYMPFEMLRKVDRLTMAHSVEGRPPFAAPSVLGLADMMPFGDMVQGRNLKVLLREAFADLLPPVIAQRPKHGFNVPIDHWLRGAWRPMLAQAFGPDSALARHGIIHKGSHDEARAMLDDPRKLNGHTLLCFILLNRWIESNHDRTHR